MGSNCAEHHPVSFKWVMAAKDNGATIIHVDPKFSRTSARCDFHVPLRSGSDVAFLGGMINYIITNKLYLEEYVHAYTNADFVVGKDYYFKDGVFSGLDPEKRRYDPSSWTFEKDANGAIVTDPEWKNPRCVFNLLKEHFSRYTLDKVSAVTGVSEENILRVYKAFTATGRPDRAGTIMYALGWTQHTNGVQIIRASTLVQLLLGNIGVAGGGINALRGEPNVQGSTDQALLYDSLPGYFGMPRSNQQTLDQYLKAATPTTRFEKSINWKSNTPKYIVSLLKAWFGDAATRENDFGYAWLPKLEPHGDYSYYTVIDNALHDKMRGGFVFGVNPCQSFADSHKTRNAVDHLDWLVCGEIHNSETSDNWHRPGVDPSKIKTEVFLLPSALRIEKEGTIANSGRWIQWFDKGVEPAGEARDFGDILVPLMNKVRELYKAEGGANPAPLLNTIWPETYKAEEWTKRLNGYFWEDTKIGKIMGVADRGDSLYVYGYDWGRRNDIAYLDVYTKDLTLKNTYTLMSSRSGQMTAWSFVTVGNDIIAANRDKQKMELSFEGTDETYKNSEMPFFGILVSYTIGADSSPSDPDSDIETRTSYAEDRMITVHTKGQTVYIANAEGMSIRIYDMTGRCINEIPTAGNEEAVRITVRGIYIVKAGESVTKIII